MSSRMPLINYLPVPSSTWNSGYFIRWHQSMPCVRAARWLAQLREFVRRTHNKFSLTRSQHHPLWEWIRALCKHEPSKYCIFRDKNATCAILWNYYTHLRRFRIVEIQCELSETTLARRSGLGSCVWKKTFHVSVCGTLRWTLSEIFSLEKSK